jgi:DNA replication protein DnaC
MNVPQRYWYKVLGEFDGAPQSVKIAKDAIDKNESVFIHGNTGSGKTHFSVGLMMYWLRKKIESGVLNCSSDYDLQMTLGQKNILPFFLPSVEFFMQLKASFDNKEESESVVLNRYSTPPLLLIDDIGAEKISDWSRQIFYTLIDRRYRDMKQTIITSNLNLTQISESIDDRISSRIIGMGKVIHLEGKDRRIS